MLTSSIGKGHAARKEIVGGSDSRFEDVHNETLVIG
jgi:hypothetical protein